ncbi:transposase [Micromonospora sp. NPDC049044]|uniref:transposase n=1 Tax=Micromonospora sp. NPDC049044 TaxID=3154827 RepID=UPI0033F04EC9
MALGVASQQLDLLDPVSRFCGEALLASSIFAFLRQHGEALFPDGLFTDLFAAVGRRSVPPSVVATVMVLQRLEGLSDREAVDRFTFDARWRYAAGVGGWDGAGRVGFAHTVLVDMRERLRRSDRPDRIFEVALDAARAAGSAAGQWLLTALTCAHSPARQHRELSTAVQNRRALRCETGRCTDSDLRQRGAAGRGGCSCGPWGAVGCS